MIPAIILFFATLAIKLTIDYRLWLMGKRNQHTRGAVVVFFALLVCSWAAGWLSAGVWYLVYWILFNGFYGLLIGEGWRYIGKESELDIFESRHKWLTPLKYLLFVTFLIVFIFL